MTDLPSHNAMHVKSSFPASVLVSILYNARL